MAESLGAAVVTGAGRGIGKAISSVLAEAGYPLAIQARTSADLQTVQQGLEKKGVRIETVRMAAHLTGRAPVLDGGESI